MARHVFTKEEGLKGAKKSRRGPSPTTLLKQMWNNNSLTPGAKHNMTREEFIQMVITHAAKGNSTLIKEIFERMDGKTLEKVEMSTAEDKPFEFKNSDNIDKQLKALDKQAKNLAGMLKLSKDLKKK